MTILKLRAPELMTGREFCAKYDITPATLRIWEHRGIAPDIIRIGGKLFIAVRAEKSWLRRCAATPPRLKNMPREGGGPGNMGRPRALVPTREVRP